MNPQALTPAHITELCTLRASAKAAAELFTDALANKATEAGLNKGALRRYICAKEADKLAELDNEASDLANLLETKQ